MITAFKHKLNGLKEHQLFANHNQTYTRQLYKNSSLIAYSIQVKL